MSKFRHSSREGVRYCACDGPMEIIYTNKMPRPIVTTDADDAKIFSELYIPHEFAFSGGTPLALNMSFLSDDEAEEKDGEIRSVLPYSPSVMSSANGSATLNTSRSAHSSPVTHKHFARILLDANYRIVRIDKCFVQGLPVYRVHYRNDVDFDMEEEDRTEVQYIFPNAKLRKQCSVSRQNPFRLSRQNPFRLSRQNPFRSSATRSSATRSSATRSSATRSSATRSSATRSSATRSSATRSSATRSSATRSSETRRKPALKRKEAGNKTPRTPRRKKRRYKNSSASNTPKSPKVSKTSK